MGMGDALGGGVSMGGPDYSAGTFDEPAPKRGGSRLRDVPSFDSFDQAAVAAAAAAAPTTDPKREWEQGGIEVVSGSELATAWRGGWVLRPSLSACFVPLLHTTFPICPPPAHPAALPPLHLCCSA